MFGFQMICKAKEKTLEDMIWQKWLMKYPHMTAETFISYSSYLDSHKPEEKKSSEKILEEVKKIKEQIESKSKAGE